MKTLHYILIAIVIVSIVSAAAIPILLEKNGGSSEWKAGRNEQGHKDTSPPLIVLIRPKNRSFIAPGTEIMFDISDENLTEVTFYVDGKAVNSSGLAINTSSWGEGKHMVNVTAKDRSNNTATAYFIFFIDLTPPEINLISPPDGSAMESGTPIVLDIEDENLVGANYTLDDGKPQCLPKPYRISTDWWTEGNHTLKVCALDRAGNSNATYFNFTIDNRATEIMVISPKSRVMRSGTPIAFDIEESTLENISYSINGGPTVMWHSPWVIGTDNWTDGTYSITVMAEDRAGHSVVRTFVFYIDDTPPSIGVPDHMNITISTYLDARNYTFSEDYEKIELNISDAHLYKVMYALNGGKYEEMGEPYVLDPLKWRGSTINVSVVAEDVVGNRAQKNFSVNLSFIMHIYMGKNWSTISIPLSLPTYSIDSVFSCIHNTENGSYDKLESYDGSWHTYDPNRPPQFNAWKEFWPEYGLLIDISSDEANFTVNGSLPYRMNINLSSEHSNFVSYPYMHPMRVDQALAGIPWYRVQRWDWETQSYINMKGDDIMLPGYSYWIYVSYSSVWSASFNK